jgi:hypothetical protein
VRQWRALAADPTLHGIAFEFAQNGVRREGVPGLVDDARRTLCAIELSMKS